MQVGLSAYMMILVMAIAIIAGCWNDLVTQAAQTTSAVPEVVANERFRTLAIALEAGSASLLVALWFGFTAVFLWHGAHMARFATFAVIGAPLLFRTLLPIEWVLAPDDLEGPAIESNNAFWAELDRISANYFWPSATLVATACVVSGCLIIMAPLLFNTAADRYFRPDGPGQATPGEHVPYPGHSRVPPAPFGGDPPGPTPSTCSAARPNPEAPPDPRTAPDGDAEPGPG